jgi:hypothetical protein
MRVSLDSITPLLVAATAAAATTFPSVMLSATAQRISPGGSCHGGVARLGIGIGIGIGIGMGVGEGEVSELCVSTSGDLAPGAEPSAGSMLVLNCQSWAA